MSAVIWTKSWLASCAIVAMVVLPSSAAEAQPAAQKAQRAVPLQAPAQAPQAQAVQVTCSFLEIAATKGKASSIDPGLKPVQRKLGRGPFKQWNDFKLLSQAQKTLVKKKTETVALKQGAATGTLVEIVDKSKARLTITLDNAKGRRVVDTTATVDAADYLIVTNELANGDGHLIALTCK